MDDELSSGSVVGRVSLALAQVTLATPWAGHRTFVLEGREIPYIGRLALLRNKRAAGRPKDLADVAWLEDHGEPRESDEGE